jgi:hypothetical protein
MGHIVTMDFSPLVNDRNIKIINMANTYHQVHIQVVFAVKYRNAVLEKE